MTIDSKIQSITPSHGNVFADLGFASQEAEKLKIKAQLMSQNVISAKEKSLKQAEIPLAKIT